MNPAEWLIRAALRSPKAPALMRGTELVATYAAFASRAASIGGWLAQRGIGPGDRVAIFMTNRTEYLEAFYAIWLAGAGIRSGITYGRTDELGHKVVEDPVHVHDLNATILHLLGIDHERLSMPFQGLDVKLTGVEPARVVTDILA